MNDRKKLLVSTLTLSLWAHLRADEDAFRNPTYRKYNEVRLECTIYAPEQFSRITSLKRFYNSFTTQGNSHFPKHDSPLLKFVSWFVPSLVCSLDKGGGGGVSF